MGTFSKLKNRFFGVASEDYINEFLDDYIEIDTKRDVGKKSKIVVKPFVISDFVDVKPALDALREGYTIALINIKPIKDRDIVELKRVVNKLKKTCDAIEGDIAGFGEDWVVVTPGFAHVYRTTETEEVKE